VLVSGQVRLGHLGMPASRDATPRHLRTPASQDGLGRLKIAASRDGRGVSRDARLKTRSARLGTCPASRDGRTRLETGGRLFMREVQGGHGDNRRRDRYFLRMEREDTAQGDASALRVAQPQRKDGQSKDYRDALKWRRGGLMWDGWIRHMPGAVAGQLRPGIPNAIDALYLYHPRSGGA